MDKDLDRARDIFWIKSLNGTFLALQIKAFGPNNFRFHAGVKKCHFGNFSEWAGMAVPSRIPRRNSNILFDLGAGKSLERLESKTRKGTFF